MKSFLNTNWFPKWKQFNLEKTSYEKALSYHSVDFSQNYV